MNIDDCVFVDAETTGLDMLRDQILEIGAVAKGKPDFYVQVKVVTASDVVRKGFKELYPGIALRGRDIWKEAALDGQPQYTEDSVRFVPEAVACNGITPKKAAKHEYTILEAIGAFRHWLSTDADGNPTKRKWWHVGKNPEFDKGFLELACKEVKELPFHRRVIDVHAVASMFGFVDADEKQESVYDVYKKMGVSEEPMPHNALRGARHVQEIFNALYSRVGTGDGPTDRPLSGKLRGWVLPVVGKVIGECNLKTRERFGFGVWVGKNREGSYFLMDVYKGKSARVWWDPEHLCNLRFDSFEEAAAFGAKSIES